MTEDAVEKQDAPMMNRYGDTFDENFSKCIESLQERKLGAVAKLMGEIPYCSPVDLSEMTAIEASIRMFNEIKADPESYRKTEEEWNSIWQQYYELHDRNKLDGRI